MRQCKQAQRYNPYQFDAGELQPHQVEVQVEYCDCAILMFRSLTMNGTLRSIPLSLVAKLLAPSVA
jgi:hypothetical protein